MQSLPFRLRAFGLVSALWTLGSCTSATLQGNVFRKGNVAFQVGPIPQEWEQLKPDSTADLATLAFRDGPQGVTIGAAGRCNKDGSDVPLRSLTQHLHLGFTNRSFESEREFQLDGRRALRTEMTASLDGVPKHMVFVVLKKDGCVYDFWRIAERRGSTEPFDSFVAGFRKLDG